MNYDSSNYYQLVKNIKRWGEELGFQQVAISDIDLSAQEPQFLAWLEKGFHGEMGFMAQHGLKRTRPAELLPGTLSVVTVRMNYLPEDARFASNLEDKSAAYISRYALGRDYHKVIRNKLKKLGKMIEESVGIEPGSYRPFVDSAPVLERALAEKSGLGWTGKHSLILNNQAGSWFFLGELFLPLALPTDKPVEEECGNCVACMTICPTGAIVEPYVVDSNRCISYLTIELKGAIPEQYRSAIGNRIYGCDDCQLICPWNREGDLTQEPDFTPKQDLHNTPLLKLWEWTETEFLEQTQGNPIRRIGYESWKRNLAVGIGNDDFRLQNIEALEQARNTVSAMVDEHIDWALTKQHQKAKDAGVDERKTKRLIKAIRIGLPRDAD